MKAAKPQSQSLRAAIFRIDKENRCLWLDQDKRPLTPKALAVLILLIETPSALVTKEEFKTKIWGRDKREDANLLVHIRALRKTLNDDAKAPEFIETVSGEGYRFIGRVSNDRSRIASKNAPPLDMNDQDRNFVGRKDELEKLHARMNKALQRERQVVFVTGEPGIGKTTLVDEFLRQLDSKQPVWIGRGLCVEQSGTGESYFPIFEALRHLCSSPQKKDIVELLRQHAPMWVLQMPSLFAPVNLEEIQQKTLGATQDRMLREIAEALEILTVEHPLVLVLEDLHWSDRSTVELLALLARERQPARLLVVGTYRVAEVITRKHPLKGTVQELQGHSQCEELALQLFSEEEVHHYLTYRFPTQRFPAEFAEVLFQATDGHPLFIACAVDDLVKQGALREREDCWEFTGALDDLAKEIPSSVQNLIEAQLGRLSEELQAVLEAASVAGTEFLAAAVAVGIEGEAGIIDKQCEALVKQKQMLAACGAVTLPDGTPTGRYKFRHALYQQVLYGRLAPARCIRLHRRIGEEAEARYGNQVDEHAAELAMHFGRGEVYSKAIDYHERAAKNATKIPAPLEAERHFTSALELLKKTKDSPERSRQELRLQIAKGINLHGLKGYAAPEVEEAFTAAYELCKLLGTPTPVQLSLVLWGLWAFHFMRAKFEAATGFAQELLALGEAQKDETFLLKAHEMLGPQLFHQGEFLESLEHLEQSIAIYDIRRHGKLAFVYGQDPGVISFSYAALCLCILGYPDKALERSRQAIEIANNIPHPYSRLFASVIATGFYQLLGNIKEIFTHSQQAITIATEFGFVQQGASAVAIHGLALTKQGESGEGIRQLSKAVKDFKDTGAVIERPHMLGMLAEGHAQGQHIEEALAFLNEALEVSTSSGDVYYQAELYRLKGQLTLQRFQVSSSKFQVEQNPKSKVQGLRSKVSDPRPLPPDPQGEAEACFLKAIKIAQDQKAKWWELRATVSLSRLWQKQGKKKQARLTLAEIYDWFTEGFETADLQEAKALLAELA